MFVISTVLEEQGEAGGVVWGGPEEAGGEEGQEGGEEQALAWEDAS